MISHLDHSFQELALLDNALLKQHAYIDGHWLESSRQISVTNPATGETLGCVSNLGPEGAEQAITSAKRALPGWKQLSANERGQKLRRWFELIQDNLDDLATLLTLEQGKPLAEAKGEVSYGAAFIDWFAEEGKRVYGDTIPAPSSDKRLLVVKQAVGVVTAITPWNFPNAMITRKAAAALAAGCTFVVRPDAQTPLSALALAELADRAGIPAGVFNVVIGDDANGIGKVLTQHPDVAKFSFTGSTRTGKLLAQQCAGGLKRVTMELGGNAPFIVFDDADLDAAVEGAIASKYRNAGQTCVCANRFLVQNKVKQAFTEKLIDAVKALTLGNGLEAEVNLGPMINAEAVSRVQTLVKESCALGARVEFEGKINKGVVNKGEATLQGSSFMAPVILSGVTNAMPIAREEIFGPVSPILGFDTEEEALALANDTQVGLAAYFYSRDIGRVWRVSEGLDYGMVGVNEGIISNAAAPFGGMKQSGFGREGSKYGLDDYLDIKYLCLGGLAV